MGKNRQFEENKEALTLAADHVALHPEVEVRLLKALALISKDITSASDELVGILDDVSHDRSLQISLVLCAMIVAQLSGTKIGVLMAHEDLDERFIHRKMVDLITQIKGEIES